jgi:hypothetical protein
LWFKRELQVPLVSNLKVHDYKFELPVAAGKWRWTTRLDVSQSNPVYSVLDIVSPYGLLRDSIPIPGEVVAAMAESIDELRANFAPSILLGPPSSLTFNVDEGRGFGPGEFVLLTNDGVYGSILGVTLTTSAAYVRVTPANVGNLALNESGQFQVEVDATNLLAASSPYVESIAVQDPAAVNNPQMFPVTIVVRPKATIFLLPTLLTFSVVKPISGPFPSIPVQTFTVQNSGPAGAILDYQIQKLTGLSDWLTSFLPASGTLASLGSDVITVTAVPPDNFLQGTYTEKLRVSGYSSNSYLDIDIHLVIT